MGGGGGKGGGGGGHTPIEYPNTLESAQRLKIIDLLCEGVAGQDVTFKNIYLDNTPIQNVDGSYNFTGIRVSALPGTHNQDYLAGFDSTDKIVSVGAEVKASKPITRTITDPLVDSVRVTLALGSLVEMKDNGDRVGSSVSLTVRCGNRDYPVTISGKTTSAYHQDVVLTDLPDAPFNISVRRNTPDSTSDSTSNATHWVSYVESIDAKFNYPNTVVVGLEIDSAQFGNKIPTRTYLNKWTQIKVPNNYDPIKRTYDGIWLGEFKTAWSNNPAWVFYDLVTDKRYGLGDRLGDFGCDKWSLYQIAKYCDQIVPDGFGGKEPRFTCNAYLSEPRDAKALLDDLASVFRGIAVWDGQMVTALQDAKKDPVATYTNANVVDGAFAYSGAAQKSIFTAVHVKYNDKNDNYATKTEYVANDDAIKRYGLNVKQITAFGCTSRGQAARVGKWLIETSIREQQMVTFKVGREGIRHLPFDIIEIADNDYAGDMVAGRVLSVAGNTITADRAMGDISSIRFYTNGQSKTLSVQSVNGADITLADTPVGIEQLGVFSATKTDVKPRLFRALSIKEDGDTYTISAVQHDENKEAIVDQGVTFEQDDTATKHTPQVSYGRVSKDGDELLIAWEGTNTTEYLIKVYKDGELYRSYSQDSAEIKLKGLPNGEYKAEIRGKSANGQLTDAVIKEWSIDYDIKGLKATPELFAIKLDWTNPTTVINKAKIEIYRSLSNNRATATKVATLSYPTDTFTQNGVKLSETHYFWLRLIDDAGNTGDWVTVSGQCSDDTSQIVASINGKITQTELSKSLINSLQSDINSAKTQAISSANVDAANKVAAEARARADAIQKEATARQQALAAQDKKQTDALTAKAQELGTQISHVEDVNDAQARQLTTLTAKQGNLTSGLEEERTARIKGDEAEATARQTLVSKVNNAESSINTLQSTKASKTEVSSLARTALQSEWRDDIDAIEIGGRNLLSLKSKTLRNYQDNIWLRGDEKVILNDISRGWIQLYPKNTSVGEHVLSFKIRRISGTIKHLGGHTRPHSSTRGTIDGDTWFEGNVWDTPITLRPISDTSEHSISVVLNVVDTENPIYIQVNRGMYDFTYECEIWDVQLERGNKATDWTPAPEDVDNAINATQASIDEFKQTQASKDQAQTTSVNKALSRIGDAESSINNLQSTKASKTEVVSLARTGLQSEWKNYADGKAADIEAKINWQILTTQQDLNNMVSQGNYFIRASRNVNAPFPNWAYVVVDVAASDRVSQTAWADNNPSVRYMRVKTYSSWSDWEKVATEGEVLDAKASIDEFKQTQASKNEAQTVATNQALSRIGDAESKITTLQSTKASKTEVSSLARTALQSEWQSAANTAKQQAINLSSAKIETESQTLSNNINAIAQSVTTLETRAERGAAMASDIRSFPTGWNTSLRGANASMYYSTYYDAAICTSPNLGKDSGYNGNVWAIYNEKYKANRHLVYKLTAETLITRGDGRVYIGLAASTSNDTLVNIHGNLNHVSSFWYAGSYTRNDDAGWHKWEAYYSFDQSALDALNTSSPKILLSDADDDSTKRIEFIKPLFIANYPDTAGYVAVKYLNIEALNPERESKIQQSFRAVDGLSSQYSIKTQVIAGGKRALAGIAVGAAVNEGTAESSVIVMADKFGVVKNAQDGTVKPMLTIVNNQAAFNGDLIANGTILGRHIKANQTISAPTINGGELNINNRFIVDRNGNLTAKSGRFEGTVLANKIEGSVANIANASVDTLQIRGNAVTLTETVKSDQTFTVSLHYPYKSPKLYLDTKGGKAIMEFYAWSWEPNNRSPTTIKFFVNDKEVATWTTANHIHQLTVTFKEVISLPPGNNSFHVEVTKWDGGTTMHGQMITVTTLRR